MSEGGRKMAEKKAISMMLVRGLNEVLEDPRFKDKWWCDIALVEVMKAKSHYNTLLDGSSIAAAARQLNLAVTISPLMATCDNHHTTNDEGIYRMLFKIKDDNNKPVRRMFYCSTSIKTALPKALTFDMAQEVYRKKLRSSPRSSKRVRSSEDDDEDDDDAILPELVSGSIASPERQSTNTAPSYDYWSSADAIKLFCPRENEHVVVALHRMMDVCAFKVKNSTGTELSYKYLLLKKSYELALEHMNEKNWKECCNMSLLILSEAGIDIIKCPKTIMKWNRFFRTYECLEADMRHHNKKVFEPRMFALYPEIKALINKHFLANIETINVDCFRNLLLDVIIPELLQEQNKELPESEKVDNNQFLISINLKTFSLSTAYKYLTYLGYRFDNQKKSYYNDGHEKFEQIAYRKKFIEAYLRYENNCYLWVQIPEDQAKMLEENNNEPLMTGIAYEYLHESISMREYHVDCHPLLKGFVDEDNKHFGGNLSIRKHNETRPLIVVGQDESAYSQFSFSAKTWFGPDGECKLLPKGEGETIMVSAFFSRLFGLGRKLNEEEIIAINRVRYGGKYKANDSALVINGHDDKPVLKDNSPFLRYFEVGAEKEGFWNHDYMALQTEDVVDCLQVLYPDHDLLFLFDQSSGHARKRHDSLNVVGLNGGWGGKQKKMRNSIIIDGCLGPHNNNNLLTIGDVQSMVFLETDEGPINMAINMRQSTKYDVVLGKKKVAKTKSEILQELIEKKGFSPKRNHSKKELENMASQFALTLHHEVDDLKEGWVGKPKGMYQILYERGWIDIRLKNNAYSLDGKAEWIDESGTIMNQYLPYCMRHILSNCSDFRDEITAMEDLCKNLSTDNCKVSILYTPKYHCEIAGEGIEYAWGLSKKYYRNLEYAKKRGIVNFRRSIRESIDFVSVDHSRKFAAKVRRYMLAYIHYDKRTDSNSPKPTYQQIEHFVKTESKTHRNVADSEFGYIAKIWKESTDLPSVVTSATSSPLATEP
jgi:hypothetical protein